MASLISLLFGQDPAASLRSRTLHSGAWIGAGFAVQRVLQLGSNLILTRLLFPEAFGLMALATVFLIGLAMISDIGLKPAIIRDPRGDEPDFLNTAWSIQVVRGLLLFGIGTAIAFPMSLVYGQPVLFPLLAMLSTTAAISGFASIGMATAERRLDFRISTIVQLSGQIVAIGLLVTLAYLWRSVWALAAANVISTAIAVLIGHLILPRHRHRLMMDRQIAKSLLKFGRWILFSTLATYLGGEGLKAVQGGLLTPSEFGVLAIAYTIAGIPNDLAMKLSASLGLSVLAETYRIAPDTARSTLHALRIRTLGISFILYAGVILLAEQLIRLLYDSRYHEAGSYLVALSVSNALASIGQGYNSAILAIGQSSSYFKIMLTSACIRITCMIGGFSVDGIIGMLYGVGFANLMLILIIWIVSHRSYLLDLKLDISFMMLLASFWAISTINWFMPPICQYPIC